MEAKHSIGNPRDCGKTVRRIRPNRNRAVFQLLFVSECFGFFAGRTAAKNIFQHLVAAFSDWMQLIYRGALAGIFISDGELTLCRDSERYRQPTNVDYQQENFLRRSCPEKFDQERQVL
jgi:hypothetical protein